MKKKVLAFSLGLIFMLCLIPMYGAKAMSDNWVELNRMDNVPANKTFTVTFSSAISQEQIDAIVIEQGNRFVSVDISYDKNKAYVTPAKPFGDGEYKLKILLENGNKYFMRFTATNKEYYTSTMQDSKVIKVYPRSSDGFLYPYYLSIPKNIDTSKDINMIVEPNNNGVCGDSSTQEVFVKKYILNGYTLSNQINKQLNAVILMPVFPRGVTVDGVENGNLYTHELDRDTLLGKDNEKIRIDEQLVSMIKNAQDVLKNEGLSKLKDKVLMVGFSASARFANRFALLHPELVQAVATGGINANPILPLKELQGQKLIYPVGIGDAEQILGRSINLEAYKNVKQYIYMGELDTNDDVAYSDGYDDPERQLIYNLIGRKQMPDRWNKTQEIFKNLPYPIQFVTYKGIGHGTNNSTINDVIEFFKQNSGDKFIKIQPHNAY